MNSYNLFQKELKNLQRLYFGTMYSYGNTSDFIKKNYAKDEYMGTKSEMYYQNIREDEYLIENSALALRAQYGKPYPRFLRELILVRIISALEVFLINSIAEVFITNKSLFMTNNVMELHQSEILSYSSLSELHSKIISKIVRELHSRGFKEVGKYYQRIFQIDFNKFLYEVDDKVFNCKSIEMYHEMRHLIVHKLGATDLKFRENNNTTAKKIKIEEDDFLAILECISKFVEFVNLQLEPKAVDLQQRKFEEKSYAEYIIEVDLLGLKENDVLNPKYRFAIEEKVYFLQDILKSIQYNEKILLKIHGDIPVIGKYLNTLRKLKKNGIIDFEIIQGKRIDLSKLSLEEIDLVKNILVSKPWKKNLHKEIAEELNLSKSKVYRIINLLKDREERI